MTVRELIEELSFYRPDMPIEINVSASDTWYEIDAIYDDSDPDKDYSFVVIETGGGVGDEDK